MTLGWVIWNSDAVVVNLPQSTFTPTSNWLDTKGGRIVAGVGERRPAPRCPAAGPGCSCRRPTRSASGFTMSATAGLIDGLVVAGRHRARDGVEVGGLDVLRAQAGGELDPVVQRGDRVGDADAR